MQYLLCRSSIPKDERLKEEGNGGEEKNRQEPGESSEAMIERKV